MPGFENESGQKNLRVYLVFLIFVAGNPLFSLFNSIKKNRIKNSYSNMGRKSPKSGHEDVLEVA